MEWHVQERRQRSRNQIEHSPPSSQPAHKDMRSCGRSNNGGHIQQRQLLANRSRQSPPPKLRGHRQAPQPAQARRKITHMQAPQKTGAAIPTAEATPAAPPKGGVPFTASTQPTISAWAKGRPSDIDEDKANRGRQQAVPAADRAGFTAEAAEARQGKS